MNDKLILNSQRTGIQEFAGQPEPQASEDPESTASPTDGQLDLAADYTLPNGTVLKGSEIQNAIGRAKLASELQAKADSAAAELEATKQQAQANADAAERLAALERRQEIEAVLKEQIPASTPSENLDDWSTGDAPETPAIDPEAIARLVLAKVQDVTQSERADIVNIIQDTVAQELSKGQAEQTKQAQMDRHLNATRQIMVEDYMNNYGMAEEKARETSSYEELAMEARREADKALLAGNIDAANDLYREARTYQRQATNFLSDAKIQHESTQKQIEYQEALMGDDFPVDSELAEPEREIAWDATEARNRREQKRKLAIQREIRRQQAKNL